MGGRASRVKGFGFEREIVQAFKAAGITARRFWGSNGRSSGKPEKADVEAAEMLFQCKRLKKLPVLMNMPDEIDGMLCRQDNSESVVVLRFDEFLKLMKDKYGGSPISDN